LELSILIFSILNLSKGCVADYSVSELFLNCRRENYWQLDRYEEKKRKNLQSSKTSQVFSGCKHISEKPGSQRRWFLFALEPVVSLFISAHCHSDKLSQKKQNFKEILLFIHK